MHASPSQLDFALMKISMYAMSAELFCNMLGNLSAILDKGFAHATNR
jgi:hypothetical protein